MANYSGFAYIQALIPTPAITTTSQPTTAQVDAWVAEGEAFLETALQDVGVTVPIEDERGILVMRSWTNLYAEGKTRYARAGAGGDGQNENGLKLLDKFDALLERIRADPAWAASMVSGGTATDDAVRYRDHTKNLDDEDFEPVFTKSPGTNPADQF